MNIYIKPELEFKLRQEENMSAVINKLLEWYYKKQEQDSLAKSDTLAT